MLNSRVMDIDYASSRKPSILEIDNRELDMLFNFETVKNQQWMRIDRNLAYSKKH